jgi:hypothetical protein
MSRFSAKLSCQLVCAGSLFFAATATSEACLFPCLWGWGGCYGSPAYYGAPAYGSPCGAGGCGFYRGYAPCACDPCACSPCGSACGTGCATGGCGVSYFDGRPVPDSGPAADGGKTYADDPNMPPAGDDDFQEPKRSDGKSDPFPPGTNPESTTPDGTTPGGDVPPGEPNAVRPLHELDAVVTLRMAPVRTRLRIEAQYRLPHVARLTVEPQSPWLPVASERSLARK